MRALGVHVSISGGIARSLERAEDLGCTAIQIFSHNPRAWAVKPLRTEQVEAFKALRSRSGIHAVIHASYLINLASPLTALREKSIALMKTEMDRADLLDIRHVVLHPGRASGEAGNDAVARTADSLHMLARFGPWKSRILLENTGGARGDVGSRINELGELAGRSPAGIVGGICLDTCHVHTAGYDLRRKGFQRLVLEIAECVGPKQVRLIHVNDSKSLPGSGRDRHEHIGAGTIGEKALARLLNHAPFGEVPLILETPQETEEDDRRNLSRVRDMLH